MKEIDFILYNMPEEGGNVQVVVKDETIWCSQKAMALLYDCSTDNIGLHLKNIFNSGELEKDSVTEKISATASDGKPDKGKITKAMADEKASAEYDIFNKTQKIDSDFDKEVRKMLEGRKIN